MALNIEHLSQPKLDLTFTLYPSRWSFFDDYNLPPLDAHLLTAGYTT